MRLPVLLLVIPCAVVGGLLYGEIGWRWVVVIAVVWTSAFLLAEECMDAIVTELRKMALRMR
jgi:MFS family permease